MQDASVHPCPDCLAPVPQVEGPHPHPYVGGSPGCWKVYGDVLAREYIDPLYGKVHRLTVDAYSVQHPGRPERRSIQSVTAHLAGLYLVLEKGFPFPLATRAIGALTETAATWTWLEPPKNPGSITIVDVHEATNADHHAVEVRRWASSVWEAWQAHHPYVSELVERHLKVS